MLYKDFRKHIKDNYNCKGLLIVELLKNSWDFKQFLEPLAVTFSGLCPTATEPDVCHSWRLLRRVDLFKHRGSADWELQPGVMTAQASHLRLNAITRQY